MSAAVAVASTATGLDSLGAASPSVAAVIRVLRRA